MESFYGVPRQPPKPPTINKIQRVPGVPEVSLVENPAVAPIMYGNTTKKRFDSVACKENCETNSFAYKKQVRFEGPETLRAVPDLSGKTFKQIYMANVPDRHLDLSIFEAPTAKTVTTNCDPQKPEQFMCNNYNPPKLRSIENVVTTPRLYTHPKPPRFAETCVQTDEIKCTDVAQQSDEPTIRDLFRIIQQQNEQIMLLQRQVGNLKACIRQPETNPTESPKKGMFAFDVKATSFEFSFRPPQKPRKHDFLEPKIQEVVEDQNSLRLDESLRVKDSYVSDVPSIQIKMDEYHSSDDEDEAPTVGLTFYKDLMDQVNKVLKKVHKQSECQTSRKQELSSAVKQATLQHLKNMGVNLAPIQESSEVATSCGESEISCVVQELLMKYLPEEKLVKAVKKPAKQKRFKPVGESEFSFATLQYMKKYNILDNNRKLQEVEKKGSNNVPKILDVTALKLQPKLL